MHPYLNLGLIHLPIFGLLVALAWLIGLFTFWYLGRRESPREEVLFDLAITASIAGLAAARFWYILGHLSQFGLLDWFRFFSRPGLDWQGFWLGFFLAAFKFCQVKKWPFLKTADLLSVALPLAEAIGRLGCFLNGCAPGKTTQLPWGGLVTGYAGQRHPLALYQFLVALLIFGFLVKQKPRAPFSGYLFWWYGFLVGLSQTILAVWQEKVVYFNRLPSQQIIWVVMALYFLTKLYRKDKIRWQNSARNFLIKSKAVWKNFARVYFKNGKD